MMADRKAVGKRFKLFRKKIGKTQTELAVECSISQPNLVRIENGRLFPNFEILSFLYTTHHLNLHWLVTGSGEMFAPDDISNFPYLEDIMKDTEMRQLIEYMSHIPDIRKVIISQFTIARTWLKGEIKDYEKNKESALGRTQENG